jgi:hypothetical protein
LLVLRPELVAFDQLNETARTASARHLSI